MENGIAELKVGGLGPDDLNDLLNQGTIADYEKKASALGLSNEVRDTILIFANKINIGDNIYCVNGNDQVLGKGKVTSSTYYQDEDDYSNLFYDVEWDIYSTPKPVPENLKGKILRL